jgi:hypothetical protein
MAADFLPAGAGMGRNIIENVLLGIRHETIFQFGETIKLLRYNVFSSFSINRFTIFETISIFAVSAMKTAGHETNKLLILHDYLYLDQNRFKPNAMILATSVRMECRGRDCLHSVSPSISGPSAGCVV